MIDEKYTDLVLAYIDGNLSEDQKKQLEALISQGEIDRKELDEFAIMMQQVDKLETPEPSSQMRDRFYTALAESEPEKPVDLRFKEFFESIRNMFGSVKFAYAVVALVVGVGLGLFLSPDLPQNHQLNGLRQEIKNMKETMVLMLLNQPSSTQRLKGVNISMDMPQSDNRVVNALLETLNNDPNVNVRLAAVEALTHHADDPEARKGLVQAIDRQKSPIIQAALADAMVSIQEKQAIPEFRKLLERDDLNKTVRSRVKNSLAMLQQKATSGGIIQ